MTALVNFSGIGSNIDFDSIRDAIITDRTQPVTLMQNQSATLSASSSALTQLNGLMAGLTTASTALTDTTLADGRSGNSSDNTIVTATATTTASPGTIGLNISRLATTLTQASSSVPTTSGAILAGGATTATFELRKGGAATGTPITIDASDNSLAGIRDAINKAGAGVTASIVDISGDGTQNELVLTSTATGAAGRVELVETTATGTADSLNLRSLNPPGAVGDFSNLDAQLTVNGLTITRPTNSISDAVGGVTLNLTATGAATVNITQSDDMSNKLQDFVNAYNLVQSFITTQYAQDSDGKPTGVLASDSTLRMVQRQMRDTVNALSTNNGGTFSNLTDIGITRDANDNLTLDTDVLNSKLQSNLSDVKSLLFGSPGDKGLFNSLSSSFSGLSDNVTGFVQTAITGYQSSIKNLGTLIANQTKQISDLKDSLTLQFAKVDAAISQINSQGTTLTAIINSLKPTTT